VGRRCFDALLTNDTSTMLARQCASRRSSACATSRTLSSNTSAAAPLLRSLSSRYRHAAMSTTVVSIAAESCGTACVISLSRAHSLATMPGGSRSVFRSHENTPVSLHPRARIWPERERARDLRLCVRDKEQEQENQCEK